MNIVWRGNSEKSLEETGHVRVNRQTERQVRIVDTAHIEVCGEHSTEHHATKYMFDGVGMDTL